MPKQKDSKKQVKSEVKEKIIEQREEVSIPKDYIRATGRRKTSVARVRLWSGKGDITINDIPAVDYFKSVGISAKQSLEKTFSAVGRRNKFDISIKVVGGGIHSQLGAINHGIARALDKFDTENFHKILKKNGLLTRDPRMKERRKFGLMGARKHKSSPKR